MKAQISHVGLAKISKLVISRQADRVRYVDIADFVPRMKDAPQYPRASVIPPKG